MTTERARELARDIRDALDLIDRGKGDPLAILEEVAEALEAYQDDGIATMYEMTANS